MFYYFAWEIKWKLYYIHLPRSIAASCFSNFRYKLHWHWSECITTTPQHLQIMKPMGKYCVSTETSEWVRGIKLASLQSGNKHPSYKLCTCVLIRKARCPYFTVSSLNRWQSGYWPPKGKISIKVTHYYTYKNSPDNRSVKVLCGIFCSYRFFYIDHKHSCAHELIKYSVFCSDSWEYYPRIAADKKPTPNEMNE